MNANEFVALVRKGDGTLRLDDLVMDTHKEQFHGRGMLRISRDHMRFEMTLPDGGTISVRALREAHERFFPAWMGDAWMGDTPRGNGEKDGADGQ